MLVDKKAKSCVIIDVAVPGNSISGNSNSVLENIRI